MHLTDLVGDAGLEQDALGRRRLAGIDVGHDADIATAIERNLTGHWNLELLSCLVLTIV
jgi:hypothetical protein